MNQLANWKRDLKIRIKQFVLLFMQYILGIIFLISVVSKLSEFEIFLNNIANFINLLSLISFLSSGFFFMLIGLLFLGIEIYISFSFLTNKFVSTASYLGLFITCLFVFYNVVSLLYMNSSDCGCFSGLYESDHITTLVIDFFMIFAFLALIKIKEVNKSE